MKHHYEVEVEFKNMIIAVPNYLKKNNEVRNYCMRIAQVSPLPIYKIEEVKP